MLPKLSATPLNSTPIRITASLFISAVSVLSKMDLRNYEKLFLVDQKKKIPFSLSFFGTPVRLLNRILVATRSASSGFRR
jgi:hypothetical protein